MKNDIYYHFTGSTLRDDSPIPPIGKWLIFSGEPIICEKGLHASKHPSDALKYAPGNFLHQVELQGITDIHDDKVVARRRKIIATIDAADILNKYARWCALSVIDLWDCPEVIQTYLATGDSSLRDVAWSAANAAVRAAAARAAYAAARAARAAANAAYAAYAARAARTASDAAMRAAAANAAYAAARAARAAANAANAAYAAANAARTAQRNMFVSLVIEAFNNAN